jgi:ABC-type lipoprotein export system ATPase subunit
MATLVYVVGRSGSGKSTSICPIDQVGIKGLNPDNTIIVNTDQKPLPAPGFASMYSEEKGNYYKTNDVI